MVKGLVVRKEKTKKGELLRVRAKKWVFVPEANTSPEVIETRGAIFRGKTGKKGNIFIASDSAIFDVDCEETLKKVVKFAHNADVPVDETPSPFARSLHLLFTLQEERRFSRSFFHGIKKGGVYA